MKKNLLNLDLKELEKAIQCIDEPKFRAKQLFEWFYKKNVLDFDLMTNLSKNLKIELFNDFEVKIPKINHVSYSKEDNSYKFLLETRDKKLIETLLMISEKRVTLCVSCMIGCPLKCKFCATGSELKYVRKLETAEIIGQFLVAMNYLSQDLSNQDLNKSKITNIVFMGMGEPLLNLENIKKSLKIFTGEDAFGMSKSRITISTAGVTPGLSELINEFGVKLAISLHFPTNEQRNEFMPINQTYSLQDVIIEAKKIKLNKRDYITIEYLMLQDINDSIEHAKKLIRVLSNLKVKINLIPYNTTKTLPANASTENQIDLFAKYLRSKSITVTVRRSMGKKLKGGCGQFVLNKG